MHFPLKSYYQISHHCLTLCLCCAMCFTQSLIFILPMAITRTRSTKLSNFSASFLSIYSTILHNLYMKLKSIISCFTSPSLTVLLQKLTDIWVKQNHIKLHLTPVGQPCWHVHERTHVSHF